MLLAATADRRRLRLRRGHRRQGTQRRLRRSATSRLRVGRAGGAPVGRLHRGHPAAADPLRRRPGAYFLFHGSKITGIKDILINCGYPLIERFPLMFFTSAAVLVIGMVRWYLGIVGTASARPRTPRPRSGRRRRRRSAGCRREPPTTATTVDGHARAERRRALHRPRRPRGHRRHAADGGDRASAAAAAAGPPAARRVALAPRAPARDRAHRAVPPTARAGARRPPVDAARAAPAPPPPARPATARTAHARDRRANAPPVEPPRAPSDPSRERPERPPIGQPATTPYEPFELATSPARPTAQRRHGRITRCHGCAIAAPTTVSRAPSTAPGRGGPGNPDADSWEYDV